MKMEFFKHLLTLVWFKRIIMILTIHLTNKLTKNFRISKLLEVLQMRSLNKTKIEVLLIKLIKNNWKVRSQL